MESSGGAQVVCEPLRGGQESSTLFETAKVPVLTIQKNSESQKRLWSQYLQYTTNMESKTMVLLCTVLNEYRKYPGYYSAQLCLVLRLVNIVRCAN